jgi:hypothetical protein
MVEWVLYRAHHPVTVRWDDPSGIEKAQAGQLRRISQSSMSLLLDRSVDRDASPRVGSRVRVEAGEYRGLHLTVFHGAVVSVGSHIVDVRLTGQSDQVQRRRYLRAQLPSHSATAILTTRDPGRYFLVQPVDVGQGGVRLRHRLPLVPGDRFRLVLRLVGQQKVTPLAQVIETWEEASASAHSPHAPMRVSRATFVDLSSADSAMIARYVVRTLQHMK